jgi:multidrug efflux pump
MKYLVAQRRAIQLLFIIVLLAGLVSLGQLGREELPEPVDEYDGMTITAQLPGASPEEVDRRLARPIHAALKSMSGIKEVDSNATEGALHCRVRFKREAPDPAALSREVSQRINQITDFPLETEGPHVSQFKARLWEDMTLVFTGGSDLERHQQWRWVEQQLSSLPGISELVVKGDRERRIDVKVNGLALAAAGTRIDQLGRQLRNALDERAAGRIDNPMDLHQLRVETRPQSPQALAELVIEDRGGYRPLQQLASVANTLEPARLSVTADGEAAWYINIYREPGSNIETISTTIRQLADEINQGFEQRGESYRLQVLKDRSEMVKRSFADLQMSIALGILLVIIVLWLFVGFRNALHAAVGIPFAFLASFIVMKWLGLNLNILTLFGLILVCGMVVDDTIVVLENILRHFETGTDKLQALNKGISEVAPSVLVATATTIAAFFPLLLMTGDMGKVLSAIPKVTIIALVASLVECFVVLPIHLYSNKHHKVHRPLLHRAMERGAETSAAMSARILNRPVLSLLLLLVLMVATAFIAAKIHFTLGNETEIRAVKISVEFSHDTDLATTRRHLQQAEAALQAHRPAIAHIVTTAGWRQRGFYTEQQPYAATLEIFLAPEAMSIALARPLSETIRGLLRQQFPDSAKLGVVLDTNTPSSDSPVKVYVYGNNNASLLALTEQLRKQLATVTGVIELSDPLTNGIREQIFRVDHAAARHYGIGPGDIALLMHMAVTGFEIGKMELEGELVPVHVSGAGARFDDRHTLNHISLEDGRQLPLSQLGVFERSQSAASITRNNDIRYLVIEGQVDAAQASLQQVQADIELLLAGLEFPPGSRAQQKGDFDDVAQSLASMGHAALLALGLCYLLLTLFCRSYTQPLIVLMVAPLAVIGVVWGQWLSGDSLSLFGVAGIIGLIGIVLNDALVWIGFYNRHRSQVPTAREAAIATVKLRFRPIFLTTITTVLALLPAAVFGAGIATDIARITVFGLSGATLLLLLFFPLFVVSLEGWQDSCTRLLNASMAKPWHLPALPRRAKPAIDKLQTMSNKIINRRTD